MDPMDGSIPMRCGVGRSLILWTYVIFHITDDMVTTLNVTGLYEILDEISLNGSMRCFLHNILFTHNGKHLTNCTRRKRLIEIT